MQIEERLAELAAAPSPSPMSAPVAPPSSYRPVLRRAGLVMLVLGAVDLGLAVWQFMQSGGTTFGLNYGALISAVLLLSGGLAVSEFLRWIGWLVLPGAVLALVTVFAQPLDLSLVQLRQAPANYLTSVVPTVLSLVALLWLLRELGSAPLMQARAIEGRKLRNIRVPQALGVLLALGGATVLVVALNGDRAQHALALASQHGGKQLHYHLRSINVIKSDGPTRVASVVTVWDDKSVGYLQVNWQE
ncbi:hypothetical protein [Duganella sacchari]|nr:hypothetical protein [Duganella sacchari]